MVTRLLRRLGADEHGIALVMTLSTLVVLTLAGTSVVTYATASEHTSRRSGADQIAFNLAEAGLNNAVATLSAPGANALNPNLLPPRSQVYEGGTATWWGTLDQATATWQLSARGVVANPTGAGAVVRTVGESVDVTPSLSQPANNPGWNYIWATRSGFGCDMTIQQSVNVLSPLYVEGNLCLENTATIGNGPLVVKGRLVLSQKANGVGTAANKVNEVHLGNGCQYWNKAASVPCAGASDNVHAKVLDAAPPPIVPPVAQWDAWYLNANPGPFYPCYSRSGTPPVFDSDANAAAPSLATRNLSVTTPFNLTPGSSYSCKSDGGELSWDASARKLTIHGTVFIDGSAYISNGAVNEYDGQGSLFLWGTFLIKNSYLCAVVNAARTACDTVSNWNPNKELMMIAANGDGAVTGQVPSGDSIHLVSATFEGALYATNAIESDTTSQPIGPMIGSTVKLGQTVNTTFPVITIVPTGMISGSTIYAQPTAPRNFSG